MAITTQRRRLAVEARELRDQGLKYREIALELEVSISYASQLVLDPDGEKNRRRHVRAREANRGTCLDCGKATGLDARSKGYLRCVECSERRIRRQGRDRTARDLALRAGGASNIEIARITGSTAAGVATRLQRSRVARYPDLEWVPAPHFKNGWSN